MEGRELQPSENYSEQMGVLCCRPQGKEGSHTAQVGSKCRVHPQF